MPALPFLKPRRRDASLVIATRLPDGSQSKQEEGSELDGLHACSEALIRAVHAKDAAAVSEAIKDAFEVLDSLPHEEGPSHTNESEE